MGAGHPRKCSVFLRYHENLSVFEIGVPFLIVTPFQPELELRSLPITLSYKDLSRFGLRELNPQSNAQEPFPAPAIFLTYYYCLIKPIDRQ
jgi:hypothetical protein